MTQIICQKHKGSQEQKLKERFKSNFQIRNKTRLYDSKIRTQEHEMCKTTMKMNFYYATYVNMNMKQT
jgi:hypothetical protein